jgi:DNA mismatch endonuclease (patch repair protein)
MDRISPKRRSKNMRKIKSKNMAPEVNVRRMVHGLGYRFRLHRKDLPGKPDLVFPSRHKVIFVHGCFWHQHTGCREGRVPGSNTGYWKPKLTRNVERDMENLAQLKSVGWKALVIWECEIKNSKRVISRLRRFLGKN